MPTPRIVPLTAIGRPASLVALAEAVFGVGDRRPGWFARKLLRECVDADLSHVAVTATGDPTDPQCWLGYVLVGTPPSLGSAARTAGTGVVEAARGRGIGTALLAAAATATRASGRTHLQLLSAPPRVGYYLRQHFTVVHRLVTLLRPSTGVVGAPLPGPQPWAPSRPASRVLVQWLPEAWAHSDSRHTLVLPHATAHVSAEGRAWLVHRLVTHSATDTRLEARVIATADALLRRLPQGHPVLLPLIEEVSRITAAWLAAGWHPIQRGTLLQLDLSQSWESR